MVPVCSPHHRLARARRVDAKALAGERWITFPLRPGAAPEPYASALGGGLALVGARAPEIIPIDSLTAQKRMVEAGFGLALLQESSVNEELRAGALRTLRIPAIRGTIPGGVIHRPRPGPPRPPAAPLPARPRPRPHDHAPPLAGPPSAYPATSPPGAQAGRVQSST